MTSISDLSSKLFAELSVAELVMLKRVVENFPKDVQLVLPKNTDSQNDNCYLNDESVEEIKEHIERQLESTEDDLKQMIGQCFMSKDGKTAVKIVGMRDDRDNKYWNQCWYEFLFEKYEKDYEGDWMCQDYIWLQEQANEDDEDAEKYKRWCLTDQTDMNIASESMFHIGKDHHLYVDYTCASDYEEFAPMENPEQFERIRAEAIGWRKCEAKKRP